MKKIFVAIAIAGLFLSSCDNKFDCICTGLSSSTSLTPYDKKAKGKDAATACTGASDKAFGIPIEMCIPKE